MPVGGIGLEDILLFTIAAGVTSCWVAVLSKHGAAGLTTAESKGIGVSSSIARR
jgi:hypothetical protein